MENKPFIELFTEVNLYSETVKELRKKLFSNKDQSDKIIRAKKFIDSHFSENIDINAICCSGHLSKYHFIRLFKKLYGFTPYQYLINLRVAEAKKLLRAQTSVAGTCYSVGFNSVTSFTALFKKQTGLTPSAFKNKKQ